MSQRIVVHDTVYDLAQELAEDRDITKKEAIRDIAQEAGYDL